MKIPRLQICLGLIFSPVVAGDQIILPAGAQISSGGKSSTTTVSNIPKSDPAGSDLIRLENGDLLHGTFGGLGEGLVWNREDIDQPIQFQMNNVRQIIFNGSQGEELEKGTSYITLINGDRLPGKIVSLSGKDLTIKSSIIGDTTIPRDLIRSLAPNPFGGELFYAGPYTSDGWMRLVERKPEKTEEEEDKEEEVAAVVGAAVEEKATDGVADEESEVKEDTPSWIYSGAAFYSVTRGPLVFDAKLPAVGILRFKASYKAQMSLNIALHADLAHPILPEKEEQKADANGAEAEAPNGDEVEKEVPKPELKFEKLTDLQKDPVFQSVPWMAPGKNTNADFFGTGYVLTVNSGYHSLTRNYFNDSGQAMQSRLTAIRSNITLPPSGETEIEIRFDRNENLIMLFVDGEYAVQWSDPSGYLGEGTGIGFLNGSNNQVKISDILVTSWNGVLDSARSMDHPDRDIALLTNGTDRFSGDLDRIENGQAFLKTAYAEIKIPLEELSQVQLKKTGFSDIEDAKFEWKEEPATILFKPYGLIKLIPESSTPTTLTGHSPYLGNLSISLEKAVMLRFLNESPDISDWFDEF